MLTQQHVLIYFLGCWACQIASEVHHVSKEVRGQPCGWDGHIRRKFNNNHGHLLVCGMVAKLNIFNVQPPHRALVSMKKTGPPHMVNLGLRGHWSSSCISQDYVVKYSQRHIQWVCGGLPCWNFDYIAHNAYDDVDTVKRTYIPLVWSIQWTRKK